MTARVLALAAVAGLVWQPLAAQQGTTLSGSVRDEAGAPIAEANVRVAERAATTAADGSFRLANVPLGRHQVTVVRIGFQPTQQQVVLGSEGMMLRVTMRASVVTLEPLQVTATALPTALPDAPQAVTVIDSTELRRSRAPSLGETVQDIAGVQNYSSGPAIGKPAIRGLTGNRVLVVTDGQRLEFQQWGEEHAPSLEMQAAAAVEVVRGPASVLYGSDALGGVVNVVPRQLPDARGRAPVIRGVAQTGYSGAFTGPEGNLMAEGGVGAFGWRAQVGAMGGDDLRTGGASSLNNSGFDALAGIASAGVRGAWGSAQVTYTGKNERFEVSEDPAVDPAFSGFQRVRTDRVRVDARLPVGRQRVEAGVGVERNRRSEFGGANDTEATTGLLANLLTADVRMFHAPIGKLEGAVGVSFSGLDFDDFGSEPFLPDYGWWNVAAFAFEQLNLGRVHLAGGLRVDHRRQRAAPSAVIPDGAEKEWSALSGNVGVVVPLLADLRLVANAGSGFRAPQAPELYADGVHAGTLAYEIGNPDLGVERSFNLDAGLRWTGRNLVAEATVFRNAVGGFIYYRPTGEREPESGLEIFRFTQGAALLLGFESSLRWRPLRQLELAAGADLTSGTNRDLDVPLPFMPPFRATYGVTVDDVRLPLLGSGPRAAFGLRGESMARQSRPDPEEFAPDGFTRLDLEGSLAWPTRRGLVTLDVMLRNLTDAAYTRPLNRFKSFALEAGRHVVVRVAMPF